MVGEESDEVGEGDVVIYLLGLYGSDLTTNHGC